MHLPVPAPHLTGRLRVAPVLLSVVYAAAIAVALTAPGRHMVAGCVVLAGLAGRTVARAVVGRRRAPAAVPAPDVAPIAVRPEEAVAPA